MSITYYSIAKIFFAASTGEIGALTSLINLKLAQLDQADHANTSHDRISQQAYMCNCE